MALPGRKTTRTIADVILWLLAISSVILIYMFVRPWKRGFFCDDNSIRYPYKADTVSFSILLGCGIVIPITTFLIVELLSNRREKHFVRKVVTSVLHYTLILLFGAATTELVSASTKSIISRLRPNFIDVCKPDFSQINCSVGYISDYECTNKDVHRYQLYDVYHSFPSGHASFSAFILLFVALYLEARLKVDFSRFLKPFIQIVLVLLVLLCGASRVADFKHHWSDVIAGFLIGASFAIFCAFAVAKLFVKEETKGSHASEKQPLPNGDVDCRNSNNYTADLLNNSSV